MKKVAFLSLLAIALVAFGCAQSPEQTEGEMMEGEEMMMEEGEMMEGEEMMMEEGEAMEEGEMMEEGEAMEETAQ